MNHVARAWAASVALHAALFGAMLGVFRHEPVRTAFRGFPPGALEVRVSPGVAVPCATCRAATGAHPFAPALTPASAPAPDSPAADAATTATAASSGDAPGSALLSWALSHNEPPVYPRAARLRGEEGRVVVGVRVERDGTLASVPDVRDSSGFESLDRAAVAAVERWTFPSHPAAGAVALEIPFVFRLEARR